MHAVRRLVRRRVRRGHGRADVRRGRGPRARELRRRRRGLGRPGAGRAATRPSAAARRSTRPRCSRERRPARRGRRGPGRPSAGPGLRRGLAELEPRHLVPRRRDRPAPRRGVAAHDALPPGHADRRRTALQAEGLLAVDPGDGSPVRCYGATEPVDDPDHHGDAGRRVPRRPVDAAPSRRPRPRTPRARSRRTPTRSPEGRVDAAHRRAAADGVVLLVPLLRGGHRRRRAGEPAGLRRARPARSTSSRSTTAGAPGLGEGLVVADRFGSLDAVVEEVRATGRRVGIWVAPFVVGARSTLATQHPDWLLGDAGRNWGDDLVGLDLTHPGVLDLLAETLHAPGRPRRRLPQARLPLRRRRFPAVARRGHDRRRGLPLRAVPHPRGGRTRRPTWSGCGAPLLPSVGLVDAMRVSPDTFHEGGEDGSHGLRGLMPLAARAWQQGRFWVNDPDCLVARPSYAQRDRWADAVAALRRAGVVLRPGRRPRRPRPDAGPGAAGARRRRPRRSPPRRSAWAPSVAAEELAVTDEPGPRSWRSASRRTSSCSTPTSTRRSAGGWSRWRRRTPTGCGGRTVAPPTQRTACLITYGDGIRRAGRDTAAHAGRLPPRPRRRPGQRRAPAADVPVDLRRRVRGRRPPRGQPGPRHAGPTSPTWPASTT